MSKRAKPKKKRRNYWKRHVKMQLSAEREGRRRGNDAHPRNVALSRAVATAQRALDDATLAYLAAADRARIFFHPTDMMVMARCGEERDAARAALERAKGGG